MIIRVGLNSCYRRLAALVHRRGLPIMISANGFYRPERGFGLKNAKALFGEADVALDSSGFVAMRRYGGYRWTFEEYVELVARARPTWWAAPDYCCEPEIAHDREEVLERVRETAEALELTRHLAADRGVPAPMPVLQGWLPDDYRRSADLMELAPLVGLGSVCRRQLYGPDGILRVIAALDRHLPPGVKLHLFGVKGTAFARLAEHERVFSVDSQAWDMAARRRHNGVSRSVKVRGQFLTDWLDRQQQLMAGSGQLDLFRQRTTPAEA